MKTPVRDASTRQMPPFILNKVVLITASSAGLGAAAARAFAAGGATVVINYCSNAQKADTLIRELSRQYDNVAEKEDGGSSGKIQSSAPQPRHVAIRADLSKRSEIIRLVEETVAIMGRIDVVVSNQGWTRMRDFNNLDENVDEEDWDHCYHMNVKSHLFLSHAAKRYLDDSSGAFITTASVAGVIPSGSSIVSIFRLSFFFDLITSTRVAQPIFRNQILKHDANGSIVVV
jgi:NAD(P)-dependent dehydrogenase (short-subunit alcohol dehydrogenase family)